METVKRRVSYADLQRIPEDGHRYELYDGELCVVPSPLPIHQIVAQRLFLALNDFAQHNGGQAFVAPFDIVLSEFNVVQPDVLYVGSDSAARINLREHVRFAPELAIEVLSPSTARTDRGRKRDLLARHRIPEYWIVDADAHQVDVWTFGVDGYNRPIIERGDGFRSATIAGLAIDLSDLFRGLD